ncbi:MAG: outer membrane beta-barrel protein [Myxococcota bacterium]
MRKPLLLAAIALLAALPGPDARADSEFGRPGPYIAVGATYGFNVLESAFDDVLGDDVDVDDTWGGHARLGYRALSWLAVEAEYEYLDNFEVSVGDLRLADLQAQTLSANLRFIVPIQRFQPYLVLGAGATLFDLDDNQVPGLEVDHSSFSGRIGLGFDVYVTRHIVLGVGAGAVLSTAEVEDEFFTGDSSGSLSYIAVYAGLAYRF